MSIAPGWQSAAPSAAPGSGWGLSLADVITRITLDGLSFVTSSRAARMASGAVIAVAELDGWDEPARDTTERVAHPGGFGTLSGLRGRGGRSITARGWIRGRTVAEVLQAKDRLGAIEGTLVVEERARSLGREATVNNTAFAPQRITPLFEAFALVLHADDPLRYSTASLPLANGAITLPNRGTEDAWPTLELVGPHNAISIAHSGGTWQLDATPSGATRIVDLREGEVWQGGARVFGAESGPAPVVRAGGAQWTVSGLGAGSARARRFEAWP